MKKALVTLLAVVVALIAGFTSPAHATVDSANAYLARYFPTPDSGTTYKSHEANVYVEQTATNGTGFFYINEFYPINGDSWGGYIGLQTQLLNYVNGQWTYVGKGLVFSIFGATGGSAASGSVLYTGSESGHSYYTLHYQGDWVVGHNYKLKVTHETDFTGAYTTFVNGWVIDTTNNATAYLGSLNVPSNVGGFDIHTLDWTEKYLPTSLNACTDIPVSKAIWWYSTTMTQTNGVAKNYTSDAGWIESGTGCSNSATNYMYDGHWREIVGATS